MKKVFVFLAILILSCNSDDNSMASELQINKQNLLGKWYNKGSITNGGSFVNYNHNCTTSKDFQEFLDNDVINYIGFNSSCDNNLIYTNLWYLSDNQLTIDNFDPAFQTQFYTVLKITNDELKLNQIVNTSNGVENREIYFTRN